jgi:hypothetical protein
MNVKKKPFKATNIFYFGLLMIKSDCLNCNKAIGSQQNYCSFCGQKVDTHRVNFHHVIHDAVHYITHTDRSIFNLLKQLSFRPGHVAREYLAGMRQRYLSPLTFFLIMVGLMVLSLSVFNTFKTTTNFTELRASVQKIDDPVVKERRLAKIDRMEKALNFMSKHSNIVSLLIATPLSALIFFLFYIRRDYNFFEHLFANFYFAGFTFLFFLFFVIISTAIFNSSKMYFTGLRIFFGVEIIYRSVAYYQLINKKGIWHYLYALLVSTIVIAVWFFLSQLVIGYYIERGFF